MNPIRKLAARMGNPLEWSSVDKCLTIITVWMLIALSTPASLSLLPEQVGSSLFDTEFQREMLPFTGLNISLWVILLGTGLILRGRPGPHRVFVTLTILQWWSVEVFFAWGVGPMTSPALMITLGQAFVALLLFERVPALIGMGWGITLLVTLTTLSQVGVLPYAPMFSQLPYHEGRPDLAWTAGGGAVYLAAFLLFVALFHYLVTRWKEREQRLAGAMQLIRRYVPSQLAEQILAGGSAERGPHERRRLTVFFSDIKNFTATTDQLEAEELSRILNEYLSEMSAIADRFGGTIDKFVGDAVMIFFGAPTATDDRDHALRCVRMAIAMQERMEGLAKKWSDEGIEIPFQIRCGINTGVATVGDFGSPSRTDYTAIGNQVNLAARLESSCTPGKILISHATWALIKDEIACTQTGEIEVKGIHYPIKTYEVA
ncbi:MAG: adenylate/guanylate cyclase domain-containing protein [Chrysiogenetes bacterium]|nr:adenylate/guanylate cyclase domain-containing protein [Chrysiogenetes bacterium]